MTSFSTISTISLSSSDFSCASRAQCRHLISRHPPLETLHGTAAVRRISVYCSLAASDLSTWNTFWLLRRKTCCQDIISNLPVSTSAQSPTLARFAPRREDNWNQATFTISPIFLLEVTAFAVSNACSHPGSRAPRTRPRGEPQCWSSTAGA
jgi:hypothetical protein